VVENCGRLHEELHNLYASPNNTGATKSRKMRWAGHLASMAEERKAYNILVRNPEKKKTWKT
jgi:hypothetical protein